QLREEPPRALSDLDPLTSLHDRRHLEKHLGALVSRNVERDRPVSLLLLDVACRFGGEEFVAAFPGVDGAIAHRIGERLRRNVGDHPYPVATEHGPLAVT